MTKAILLCVLPLLLQVQSFAAGWTDRKEYELALAIRSESSPQKKLALLDAWEKAYPKSDLRFSRLELTLAAYESVGERARMMDTARAMLADQPKNPIGLYWYTILSPESTTPTPEILDGAEKAANSLLAALSQQFEATRKPAALSGEQWETQRVAVENAAHRTLGWVAWQRGDFAKAGEEFSGLLKKDSQNSEITFWLGVVSALDRGKQSYALWELARAAAPARQKGVAEDQRRQADALTDRVYASYHGGTDGLEQLKTASAASTFPPSDFLVESATVIKARKAEEELKRTNPELAAWTNLRQKLQAADGQEYFAKGVEGMSTPTLKGKLLRSTPERNPQEIAIAVDDQNKEDIVLKFTKPLAGVAPVGTSLLFDGLAQAFTKDPFTLTILTEPAKVLGWPEQLPSKRR